MDLAGAPRPPDQPPSARRLRAVDEAVASLREAKGKPITTGDIALVVMKARGLNPDDAELLVTIRKRVEACMWKLKQGGAVLEKAGVGELKEWPLTRN